VVTINDVISEAQERFGSRSVMKLTDKSKQDIPAQRTGIPQLDLALGVGGLPKGRCVEIYGPESSGKTTLALTVIAQAQKEGAWAWYGDMEHALDPAWCETIGVDLDKLLLSQPDCGEDCLDMLDYFIKTDVIDIVVVDSVASLVTKAELAGSSGDAHIGKQARLMSQHLRKEVSILARTDCVAIYINQIREKIGVMFGSPETTPGGRALKFYSSIRLDVRRIGSEKVNDQLVGNKTKITIKKNKVAPPFKICEALLMFDSGFNLGPNLLEAGIKSGVFEKDSNTYSYGDIKMGVGKRKAAKFISEMEDNEVEKIYKEIAGEPLKKKKEEMAGKKKDKLAKYYDKYNSSDDDELKEQYAKKIKKLGGELPAA